MCSRRKFLLFASAASIAVICPALAASNSALGKYNGRIVAEWLDDHRKMRLLEPFEFIAPDLKRWPVPELTIVDGASIPQVFWSLIGGPFEGAYRSASVIHDFYCQTRTRKYEEVHKVFFEGMKASGVDSIKARLMYEAVLRFGPSWDDPKIDPDCEIIDESYDFNKCSKNSQIPPLRTVEITNENLSAFIADIENYADAEDIRKLRKLLK
ncbi:MAG: DUF1353 domain-containing protein [Pseudomonadota bacterium]